jgi:hypothetical protein
MERSRCRNNKIVPSCVVIIIVIVIVITACFAGSIEFGVAHQTNSESSRRMEPLRAQVVAVRATRDD